MKSIVVRLSLPLLFCLVLLLVLGRVGSLAAQDEAPFTLPDQLTETMRRMVEDHQPAEPLAPLGATPCVGGTAAGYPCSNVDLLAFMPLATIGGGEGNDIWGWTDPQTGKEYALMGRTNGTAFVDISDPVNPVYLGNLPTHTTSTIWRDIKVYNDHAFIVSEAGGHGMQVFDLTRLRNVPAPPVTFTEDGHYPGFGNAHNLVINEDSGFAYGVGTGTCSGGLHMVNIQNPTSPTNAGCFSSDGYTHDAQCVNYIGPDTAYQGREICFNANEDTVTIVDVTNKTSPMQLAREGYAGSAYTHQVWTTEDHEYLLVDDELDEQNFGHNTRTYIWNIADLNAPVLVGFYTAGVTSIDHNLYVVGRHTFEANYTSGLRILDITNIGSGSLSEVGYFDIYPANNSPNFSGAWSVYPFFESGVIIVSGIEQGLFILDPVLYDAQMETPKIEQDGTPGQHVTYEFVVDNLWDDDSYTLGISGNVWPTSLVTSSPLAVTGGTTATITVEVHVPSAPTASEDTFTLTLTSTQDSDLVLTAIGTTHLNQTFVPLFLPLIQKP